MRKLTPAAPFTVALSVAVSSCSGSDNGITDPPPGPEPTAVVIIDGNGETLGFNEDSAPLVVAVLGPDEAPLEGASVTFTSSGVEHSLSAEAVTTDAEGLAAVTVASGTEEGQIEVTASVDGLEPVVFTLTVEEGGEGGSATLSRVSGDDQAFELEAESDPLVVELRDGDGNPMEGVTITFSGSGVEHSLSAESVETDADGRAGTTVTAGTEEGQIEIEATAEGVDPIVFVLTVEGPLSFLAPDGRPRGLAWDGTHLWVVAGLDSSDPIIYQLDPTDGSVLNSFRAPGTGHRDLTWDGEALWYSGHGPRTIFRLDPADGTILNEFESPRGPDSQPRGLAWDGEHLWHSDAAGPERLMFRLDPETGEVLDVFPSPVTLPVALEWDGEHLWTSQLTSSGDIVRFDVLGNVIDTMASPAEATAGLAYDAEGGFMWMSDYAEDEETVLIRRVRIQSDP
jgi:hypothetical protein